MEPERIYGWGGPWQWVWGGSLVSVVKPGTVVQISYLHSFVSYAMNRVVTEEKAVEQDTITEGKSILDLTSWNHCNNNTNEMFHM